MLTRRRVTLYYHKDEERYCLADDETHRQVKAEHVVVAVRNCSRGEVGLQIEGKISSLDYAAKSNKRIRNVFYRESLKGSSQVVRI